MVLNSHLKHGLTDSPKYLNRMDTLKHKQTTPYSSNTSQWENHNFDCIC